MELVIAIALGVVGGFVGIIPFFVARGKLKARMKKDGMGGIAIGMTAMLISFVVLVVEIVLCYLLAASYFLPFAISVIVVFLLGMGAYTATLMRK